MFIYVKQVNGVHGPCSPEGLQNPLLPPYSSPELDRTGRLATADFKINKENK